MKAIMFVAVAYVFLTGCATVDGVRTDVATGVTKVADWIKPCQTDDCKKE